MGLNRTQSFNHSDIPKKAIKLDLKIANEKHMSRKK